jgi:hypothetical protein
MVSWVLDATGLGKSQHSATLTGVELTVRLRAALSADSTVV